MYLEEIISHVLRNQMNNILVYVIMHFAYVTR